MGSYKDKPSFKWWACTLYPDEDKNHKIALDYITSNHLIFPSYLYIKHDAEINIDRRIDNNMNFHEVDASELEELFQNVQNEKFAEDIAPEESIPKDHYHVCFKLAKAKTYFGALKMFKYKDDNNVEIPLLQYVMPIYYTDRYFTYMLHQDLQSRMSGKIEYSYKDLHGDTNIITKLVIDNTNFVLKLLVEVNKFITMNPDIDSRSFLSCVAYLARADPVKANILREAYKQNHWLVTNALKDSEFRKKYHLSLIHI